MGRERGPSAPQTTVACVIDSAISRLIPVWRREHPGVLHNPRTLVKSATRRPVRGDVKKSASPYRHL